MESTGEQPAGKEHLNGGGEAQPGAAREMSLHLLHMLETRLEAAGIVLQAEGNRIITRVQLQVLGGAALFIALWGGIVLLAIALPENLRVPVLSGVVAAFVIAAVWALLKARSMLAGHEVGSLHWFLDSLKLDLEVLSRSLSEPPPVAAEQKQGSPGDYAA